VGNGVPPKRTTGRPISGISAVRRQNQEEPAVREALATNEDAERFPRPPQGPLRDPEGGCLLEHLGRRAFSVCQRCLKELHRVRQRRTIKLRSRLNKERLRRVGCRDAL